MMLSENKLAPLLCVIGAAATASLPAVESPLLMDDTVTFVGRVHRYEFTLIEVNYRSYTDAGVIAHPC